MGGQRGKKELAEFLRVSTPVVEFDYNMTWQGLMQFILFDCLRYRDDERHVIMELLINIRRAL